METVETGLHPDHRPVAGDSGAVGRTITDADSVKYEHRADAEFRGKEPALAGCSAPVVLGSGMCEGPLARTLMQHTALRRTETQA